MTTELIYVGFSRISSFFSPYNSVSCLMIRVYFKNISCDILGSKKRGEVNV